MKNKLTNNKYKNHYDQGPSSAVIKIENSEALDIFGINNENLSYFEKTLPLKIFQKGKNMYNMYLKNSKENRECLNGIAIDLLEMTG